MQSSETLSYKIASFMERRSGWIILSTIVITALLTIPLLTMAPDENASENPGGQVFDLQDDIDERFPPAVHSAGIVVEARGEDVLTQKALGSYTRTQKGCGRPTGQANWPRPDWKLSPSFSRSTLLNLNVLLWGSTPWPTRYRR